MSAPAPQPPQEDSLVRHLVIVGVLVVVIYTVGYWFIEVHLRSSKGPWEITFLSDERGHPTLAIAQPTLKISEKVHFPDGNAGRTNVAEVVRFRETMTNLPFGEMLMQDALYLPGTITLRLSGHQVEILPRTLIVDEKEFPWKDHGEVSIAGER